MATPARLLNMQIRIEQLLTSGDLRDAAFSTAAQSLWQSHKDDEELATSKLDELAAELYHQCVRVCLAPKDTSGVERCMQLLSVMVASGSHHAACSSTVGSLVEAVSELTRLADDVARARGVRLLQLLLDALQEVDYAFEGALEAALLQRLVARLDDRVTDIRRVAAQIVPRLITPGDPQDVAVAALLQQLAVEPTQAVRVALIAHLPVNTETLQPLMDRCCDTAPEVRAAVFKRLAALPPGVIRGEARDVLLRAGLRDRVQAVAEAAQQLVAAWLQRGCGGDTERLLQLMELERYPDTAELVLAAAEAQGALGCEQWLRGQTYSLRARAHACLRGEGDCILSPAAACLWRFTCCGQQRSATQRGLAAAGTRGAAAAVEAAEAEGQHQVLEAVLPDSPAELLALIQAHLSGGAGRRCAAGHLLRLAATCMDWTDRPSAQAGLALLRPLLATSCSPPDDGGSSSAWEEAVVGFAAALLPDPGQLLDEVLPLLTQQAQASELGPKGAASQQRPDEAGQQQQPQPAASASQPGQQAGRLASALRLGCLAMQAACQQVVLAPGPGCQLPTSLDDFLQAAIQPALQQQQDPEAGAQALRALTLACLLAPGPLLLPAVAAAAPLLHSPHLALAAQAGSCLADLLLLLGGSAVEAAGGGCQTPPPKTRLPSVSRLAQQLARGLTMGRQDSLEEDPPAAAAAAAAAGAGAGPAAAAAAGAGAGPAGIELEGVAGVGEEEEAGAGAGAGAGAVVDETAAAGTNAAGGGEGAGKGQGQAVAGARAPPPAALALEKEVKGGGEAGGGARCGGPDLVLELQRLLARLAAAQTRSQARKAGVVAAAPGPALLRCAEGLARLLLHRAVHQQLSDRLLGGRRMALTEVQARRVLAQLLVLHMQPGLQDSLDLQQALAAFFQEFCSRSAANKQLLSAVLLPCTEPLVEVAAGPRKYLAARMVKFAAQLLHLPLVPGAAPAGSGSASLLCSCLRALVQLGRRPGPPSTACKEYMKEVALLAASLDLVGVAADELAACAQLLALTCSAEAGLRLEASVVRALGALQARLGPLLPSPAPPSGLVKEEAADNEVQADPDCWVRGVDFIWVGGDVSTGSDSAQSSSDDCASDARQPAKRGGRKQTAATKPRAARKAPTAAQPDVKPYIEEVDQDRGASQPVRGKSTRRAAVSARQALQSQSQPMEADTP